MSANTDPQSAPESQPQSAEPAASAAPEAGAAPATEGAAPAGAPKPAGPNLKNLPPIKRAEVVFADGGNRGGPGGPGGGGGPGGFRGRPGADRGPGGEGRRDRGERGGRPERKPASGQSGQEKAHDMSGVLNSVKDEAKKAGDDAELNAEIEAMLSASAAEESAKRSEVKPAGGLGNAAPAKVRGPRVVQSGREHRRGKVVSVGPTDIFLEFGPKELGVVQRAQYQDDEVPKVGDEIEVVIDRFETAESLFICSKPGSVQKAAWELLEVGQVIEARVSGVNKGGLDLEVAGHRAFMPAGQVSLDRIPDLSVLVGEKLTCTVTKVDRRGSGNIVLSRRDLLQAERKEKGEKLRATLAEGQHLEGVVRKIMPFGAFIDVGGLDGLCHISDMTYDRVIPSEKNVQKYVQEGAHVKVVILKMDPASGKIALGMKQLAEDPYAVAVKDLSEGSETSGRVVRMTEFGAFINLAPGVDGLVHISEIAHKRIAKPEEVLKIDEVVAVKVVKIDPATRKISLSIKALKQREAPAPGSRDALFAEKNAAKAKAAEARLAEIQKETPELRRQREQFRGKQLSGGFGKDKKVAKFMGQGLGDIKLG